MSQTPSPLPSRSNQDPYAIEPPPQAAAPPPGQAKIDQPGLMEGFEENADFTKDPELERVVAGKPLTGAVMPSVPVEPPRPDLVRATWAWEHVFWAVGGSVLLVAAMVASGINVAPAGAAKDVTSGQRVLSVLLTLYTTLLHTGTGVAAVFVAAHLQRKRLGRVEVAAARMLAAVAAFVLLFNLNMTLTTGKFEETVAGALVYLAIVALTFRLFTRDAIMFVVGAHFLLWLIVSVGMELSRARG